MQFFLFGLASVSGLIKSRPGVHDNSVLYSQHDLIIQGYAFAVYQKRNADGWRTDLCAVVLSKAF